MAAFFASCNDEETGKENKWFFAPEAGVSGTTVEVSCRTKFGDGVLSSAQAGFAYAPIRSDNTGSFTETTDVTVDGQVMSCRLTGLDAETSYLIYAFVDMGSGGRMQSKPVVVKTGVDPVLPDDPRFGVPECSQVTASSATVSCTFDYIRAAKRYPRLISSTGRRRRTTGSAWRSRPNPAPRAPRSRA